MDKGIIIKAVLKKESKDPPIKEGRGNTHLV